jgi:hypothetical protein
MKRNPVRRRLKISEQQPTNCSKKGHATKGLKRWFKYRSRKGLVDKADKSLQIVAKVKVI